MSLHELTPEQQEIRALARRFADEKIAPRAAEWDREHHFPRELFAELGELGLMGTCVPVEQGGAGVLGVGRRGAATGCRVPRRRCGRARRD